MSLSIGLSRRENKYKSTTLPTIFFNVKCTNDRHGDFLLGN